MSDLCRECGQPLSLVRTLVGDWRRMRCYKHGIVIVRPQSVDPTGEELRDEAVEELNTDPGLAPWRVVAKQELARLAAVGEPFTSEDITRAVGVPPRSGAVGALVNAASKRGEIVAVGWDKAERPNQHAAMLRVWKGVRRA